MVDINIIRGKYAAMQDSELISFASEEGHKLSMEGFLLLKEEFLSRKLDPGIFESIETVGIQDQDEYLKKTGEHDHYTTSSLSYVFDEQENGKNDQEIIAGLMERGLEESIALQLVSKSGSIARQELKKAALEKITGGLILVCGIAITFLPLSGNSNKLIYILAYCAIIFGALRFIKGMYNKNRFKKIINNITT